MKNKTVFIDLFKKVYKKCFGGELTSPLTETDSKLLSNKIFEKTGLVIGAKSIKNYSYYVLKKNETKEENPSVATLDTFARYVLDAPNTNEIERKEKESHFPYWFQYKGTFTLDEPVQRKTFFAPKDSAIIFSFLVILTVAFFIVRNVFTSSNREFFKDDFNSISTDSLIHKGWILKTPDTTWWNRRNTKPGVLTLFTLKGDNWPLNENSALIKNMLIRKIKSDCFTVEVHFRDFVPGANWQQAGILLLEDSTFKSRMIRFTILYNDFFGGYQKEPEISVQAVSSSAYTGSKPEEITQLPLFNANSGDSLVAHNLHTSALKIEKLGNLFRFLYIASPVESFAYHEAKSTELEIKPAYIGIFALQGWAEHENILPVNFDSFVFSEIDCKK